MRAATKSGAELLGEADRYGTVEAGKLADLAIVAGDPLANLKLLYGTGHQREGETTGGVRYTVKGGIVYDARALCIERVRKAVLADAR